MAEGDGGAPRGGRRPRKGAASKGGLRPSDGIDPTPGQRSFLRWVTIAGIALLLIGVALFFVSLLERPPS